MKNILFITGTRADYGKIKSLMHIVENHSEFNCFVYVTGMHLLSMYGNTYTEVEKDGYRNIFLAWEDVQYESAHESSAAEEKVFSDENWGSMSMSSNTSKVIAGLTKYLSGQPIDLIIVHGDRTDALAGAITGALNNIPVAHIEGGELSGTIDDSIRHAITKFSGIHFVANEEAKKRVMQLGEPEDSIYVLGSPDIDVMLSADLPTLREVKESCDISFDSYAIVLFHPVTTEIDRLQEDVQNLISALEESEKNYLFIYPNNDMGSEIILNAYQQLEGNRYKFYPSLPFEYFLTLLKEAEFIIGNSSSGIREAGVYGIKAIDIGTRQAGRYSIERESNIIHVEPKKEDILAAICKPLDAGIRERLVFGDGDSTQLFKQLIEEETFWNIRGQKTFVDLGE